MTVAELKPHNEIIDQTKLAKLAELSIKVGLQLAKGQNLLITAPVDAKDFVRLLTREAYKAGAGVVTTLYGDDQVILDRFKYADDSSFDVVATWLSDGMAAAFGENTARLAVVSSDPNLLAGQDVNKISRLSKANGAASRKAMDYIASFAVNWNLVAYPNLAWAKLVFPNCSDEEALHNLAEAIFDASRINTPDPIAAWEDHNKALHLRRDWLNEQRFSSLHFKGPNTDLTVGLADRHSWSGGASLAKNGVICNPNIPTEEVFTTPHAERVEGYVSSTKPLSHNGAIIDNIWVRFEKGRIVEAKASCGEEAFKKLIATDENACRLGEVALVPDPSPISQSGLLFYNTLFDENAASHIALGQCYSECFLDNATITPEEVEAFGGNKSLIHVDWMIGSAEIDVDGIKEDGTRVAVMRSGDWAFKV